MKIHVQKKNRKKMFIAALLIIAITEKKKKTSKNLTYPSTENWMENQCYSHTVEYD